MSDDQLKCPRCETEMQYVGFDVNFWCPDCGALGDPESGKFDLPSKPRDKYHTMSEVYAYRMVWNALALNAMAAADTDQRGEPMGNVWRSKLHHDGTMFDGGYFVVGFQSVSGQVTNHYKLEHWDAFHMVPELDRAPEYDGHTPAVALERLKAELGVGHADNRQLR